MLRGMKEICTEATSSRQGQEPPPVLLLRARHKVPVTVQEDVQDTKIWSDYINVKLVLKCWMKESNNSVKPEMPFNFHDFL